MEKSAIYVQRSGTRDDVDAELWDDISDLHLDLWRSTWVPMMDNAARRLRSAAVPLHKWPQDLHWDWGNKTDWSRPLLTLQRFAITCGGALQGLMLVNLTKLTARLPSQKGKDLAYIEFVSTAPWNRPEISGLQQFHGIGINMVRAAVELSRNEGFHGRIGLHSLSQAASFYGKTCGMSALGQDRHYDDLDYFEMTPAQADAFCRPA
ncbi:MAG: GNAT family N-acetyltransferase [Verrucomicrobia bacterium]|nr:MAG: GNAT family N-acetyltransferase [Verrucomicrobiota bacterium]